MPGHCRLPSEVRALGVVAFVAVLVALRRPRGPSGGPVTTGNGFGRAYWLVVAGEVLAGAVGVPLLNGPLDASRAVVAWISFVVGVHFFALAIVWRRSFFHWLGGSIAVCGALGLALAAAGSSKPVVATIGGVLPGALLLTTSYWGATSGARSDPAASPSR